MEGLKHAVFAFLVTVMLLSWLALFVKNSKSQKLIKSIFGAYIIVTVLLLAGGTIFDEARLTEMKEVFTLVNANENAERTYEIITENLVADMLRDKGFSVVAVRADITIKDKNRIYCSKLILYTDEDEELVSKAVYDFCGVYPDFG